jgi:hypothetical protein
MKKLSTTILALLVCAAAFAQKKVKPPVEGRIYAITMTEQDKKKAEPFKDEFSFIVNAKFKSTYMLGAGFQQSDYEYEVDSTTTPVTIKFTVEAKNESQERFSWEGTITDDKTEGTAIIRKKGKIEHTYTFTGTWKNKKKPKPAPKTAPVPQPAPDSTKTE